MNEVEQTARTIMLKLSLPSLFPLEGKMVETGPWLIALIEQGVLDTDILCQPSASEAPDCGAEVVKCCLCSRSGLQMICIECVQNMYDPSIQLKTPPPLKRQNNIQDDYPGASASASPSPSSSEGDDY